MPSGVYNTFKGKDGNDWAAGADSAYKWMLVTSSYTPNADHDFVSDVVANEISGGAYTRQNIASRTKAVDDSTDAVTHSANNPIFTGLSAASPKYMIGFRVVGSDSDHQLVCWLDLGTNTISSDFLVKLNGTTTTGIAFKGT